MVKIRNIVTSFHNQKIQFKNHTLLQLIKILIAVFLFSIKVCEVK